MPCDLRPSKVFALRAIACRMVLGPRGSSLPTDQTSLQRRLLQLWKLLNRVECPSNFLPQNGTFGNNARNRLNRLDLATKNKASVNAGFKNSLKFYGNNALCVDLYIKHLAATISARLQVNVVWAAKFARLLIFYHSYNLHFVARTAHANAAWGLFSAGNCHIKPLNSCHKKYQVETNLNC